MNPLLCPTPARWLDRALSDVDTLLLDHAHCEKKAASTMLGLVFRTPEMELSGALSRMAREELTHFEMALRELRRRGRTYERLTPSAYAGRLAAACRKRPEPEALVDAFVAGSLIEARSCERIGLLADAIDDPHLKSFYQALHPAEERHHLLLLEAAARFGDPAPRLVHLAQIEAALVTEGEDLVRMHA
ncbi:MAG: tRNA isopentenyl-2-thiomethyl-A-37 hydroxylase MiaE [Pseudomonadota bacterium]|nr:tRNA isopentenyl-2-thiomethyl-A-37 hydroxylase MiaE [Pseudomonadota bacterium]